MISLRPPQFSLGVQIPWPGLLAPDLDFWMIVQKAFGGYVGVYGFLQTYHGFTEVILWTGTHTERIIKDFVTSHNNNQ
jgi:hypothetical protein